MCSDIIDLVVLLEINSSRLFFKTLIIFNFNNNIHFQIFIIHNFFLIQFFYSLSKPIEWQNSITKKFYSQISNL